MALGHSEIAKGTGARIGTGPGRHRPAWWEGRLMVRGEGTTVAKGVTPDEVFDFVLDPAQYTKADTKMVWVTKLADTPDGMVAREDGKFLGRFPGSVITRYRWKRPNTIDVTLEHGVPRRLHAWFEIQAVDGGTRIRHVEELDLGRGPLGWLHDAVAGKWFAHSVDAEVAEIGRLLEAGERGRGTTEADEGPDRSGV
jgi:Polyketide cyclase / dehydrase and lipid transport